MSKETIKQIRRELTDHIKKTLVAFPDTIGLCPNPHCGAIKLKSSNACTNIFCETGTEFENESWG